MWKRVNTRLGKEWYNSESRIRLLISPGSLSGSYHVFVYRRHLTEPDRNEVRPTFSRFFPDHDQAWRYAHELMNTPGLNFVYLGTIERADENKIITYLNGVLNSFMTKIAKFTVIGDGRFYREGKTFFAKIERSKASVNNSVYVVMRLEGTPRAHREFLGFMGNSNLDRWMKDEKWIIDRIDQLAKSIYGAGIVKEVLDDMKYGRGEYYGGPGSGR